MAALLVGMAIAFFSGLAIGATWNAPVRDDLE